MAASSFYRFDVVHAPLLRHFREVVTELGGDAESLLEGSGIDGQALDRGETMTTYRQIMAVLERAAERLPCREFGMRLAARQGGAVSGPLGKVMMNSRTFGDALNYVCSHAHGHSLAARIWQERTPGYAGAFFGHEILVDGRLGRDQMIEQLMLLAQLFAQDLTGGRARVRVVQFRHRPLSPLATYRRYFGCKVLFEQDADGVFYADADLARPVVAADHEAYRAAVAYLDTHHTVVRAPLHALVRGAVMQFLWRGQSDNARVAAELKIHPRTLHRRLRAEGTSFQQVKDEVRRDVVLYYLARTDLEVAEISEKLGFAEQSVLARRCRRWFGAPPSVVRQNHAGENCTAPARTSVAGPLLPA